MVCWSPFMIYDIIIDLNNYINDSPYYKVLLSGGAKLVNLTSTYRITNNKYYNYIIYFIKQK